jgi:hypothetical protein
VSCRVVNLTEDMKESDTMRYVEKGLEEAAKESKGKKGKNGGKAPGAGRQYLSNGRVGLHM